MAKMDKLSTYRTTWEQEGSRGSVTYANTRIVAWEGDTITLNSGGWQTVTTKRKMNQASNQFFLRFCVYQKAGEWFVDVRRSPAEMEVECMKERETSYHYAPNPWAGLKIPFRDGMKFDRWTGEILA